MSSMAVIDNIMTSSLRFVTVNTITEDSIWTLKFVAWTDRIKLALRIDVLIIKIEDFEPLLQACNQDR